MSLTLPYGHGSKFEDPKKKKIGTDVSTPSQVAGNERGEQINALRVSAASVSAIPHALVSEVNHGGTAGASEAFVLFPKKTKTFDASFRFFGGFF